MKKKVLLAVLSFAGACIFGADWHFPLYLDMGSPAKNRVEVSVFNSGKVPAEGEELKIPAKELGLVGKKKKSIRVVSENGRELLWTVFPDSDRIGKNSSIIVPVDCAPSGSSRFWIYYNAKNALEMPDYLVPTTVAYSESFENNEVLEENGWMQKDNDEKRVNSITSATAHKGKKSVHTHIPSGSKPNWIAVKKQFNVKPSKGKVTMYVKCENAEGPKPDHGVGFYVALFGKDKREKFFFSPRIKGTQDWTKLEADVEIPEGYTRMNIGTVAYISGGDAYFDDLSFEFKGDGVNLSYEVKKAERLSLSRVSEPEKWDVSQNEYDVRILASIFNLDETPTKAGLGFVPIKRISAGNFPQSDFAMYANGKPVDFMLIGDSLVFKTEPIPPRTERQYSLYLKRGRKNQLVETSGTKQSSYIMSDQRADTRSSVDRAAFEKLFNSEINLVKNPSFENGMEGWYKRSGTTGEAEIVDGGIFGKKALRVKIPGDGKWYGLQQDIPAEMGKSYICALSVLTKEQTLKLPRLRLALLDSGHSVYFNGKSNPSDNWEINSIVVQNRSGSAAKFVVNLNESEKSDFLVDGVFLSECRRAERYEYETPLDSFDGERLSAWQVNSVIKVFPFYAPPLEKSAAKISLARNESENLQLAVRSNKRLGNVEISVSDAVSEGGAKLPAPQVGVAGYVVVDAKSNYENFSHLKFHELCVPNNSMAEVYADPIIPQNTVDISACKTESVWLTFSAGENAKAGVYKGKVDFKKDGKVLESVPFEVRVFDFSLPKNTHLMALFDSRGSGSNGGWRPAMNDKGIYNKFYDRTQLQRFMASKRATVDHPDSFSFNFENGKCTVDFTEFDKFCKMSFEELGLPLMYLNVLPGQAFALPLRPIGGESPYEGEWPYSGLKDFSQFRPAFKKVVSERLKTVFEHVRKKGWVKNFILFMSDEPYYDEKNIADMLNAYFGLIHENAPDARIYTSTWGYAVPLEKTVDVWGLNMSAAKTPAEIKKIDAQGKYKVFTTDGNYCIDTPYNAQERIMAAFCFAGGFLGYEYWGVDWYMQNPFKWGMHKDRISSPIPNVRRRNRFPNGDGYFIYSGEIIGRNEIFSSVRMESVRDGQEDYEYFIMLEDLAKKTGDKAALATLEKIKSYAVYPNPGARNSTELLPDPDAYTVDLRSEIAAHIERLKKLSDSK